MNNNKQIKLNETFASNLHSESDRKFLRKLSMKTTRGDVDVLVRMVSREIAAGHSRGFEEGFDRGTALSKEKYKAAIKKPSVLWRRFLNWLNS